MSNSLYTRAISTDGFFSVDEASLLIESIAALPSASNILEIGSYRGRSTLFGLSALGPKRHLFAIDSFVSAAAYSGHSFKQLRDHIRGDGVTVLPMTLIQAYPHLKEYSFSCVFIDGDHSLLGVIQDLCYSLLLLEVGGILLCHDVDSLFPGVDSSLEMLRSLDILTFVEKRGTLGKYKLSYRPEWLTNPEPVR